jgi:DNA invertase Pin-like site-specific DNA recombinase
VKPGLLDSLPFLSSGPDSDSTLGAVVESMKGMKRAVLYARASGDLQAKEGTIGSQVVELRRQVSAAGHVLVKQYVDDGYPGPLLDRPALEQLRKDLKTDLFDVIYFLEADRIARELTIQTIIIEEILKHQKQLIIKGKDFVKNPENQFTLQILGAVSEFEHAKILERTTRGKQHRLAQGFLPRLRREPLRLRLHPAHTSFTCAVRNQRSRSSGSAVRVLGIRQGADRHAPNHPRP